MSTLINKDKQISKQRQEFVEHNFEAMVGARKRRYNDTQAQKQRTEFFEDYYLLYTRNKQELDQQKAMWNELKEWLKNKSIEVKRVNAINEEMAKIKDYIDMTYRECYAKMQELEGEKDVKD